MMVTNRETMIGLCGALLLSACAVTEAAKERSIFVRQTLSAQTYSSDLTSCDTYVNEKGASSNEQGGAAVAGLLLGGIVGLAASSNAYDKSQNRLFEECMYGKGYRLVTLPIGFGTDPRTESDNFDQRRAGLDLIEQNKMEELIAWENAKNSDSQSRLQTYLQAYPNGYFAVEARKRMAGGVTQKAKPK